MCKGGKFSSILAMDISNSLNGNNLPAEKQAAELYIDLIPEDSSELSIVSFNHQNYLNQDFTNNKSDLKNSFHKLQASGGTNFNAAFLDKEYGALLVAERAKYPLRIILVTDGNSDGDEDAVIKMANELNAKIFVVLIEADRSVDPNYFIRKITAMTNGFIFKVSNEVEALIAFRKLAAISSCEGAGCEISWDSEPTCKDYKQVVVKLKNPPTSYSFSYYVDQKSIIKTSISNNYFSFDRIPIGKGDSTVSVKLTNNNYPVNITKIYSNNKSFTIDMNGAIPPFLLGTGESRLLKLKYLPVTDTIELGTIVIEKEYCEPHNITMVSFDREINDSIKIKGFNGRENILAGGDTIITWIGNPKDTVTIDFSTDGGKNWENITKTGTGLKHLWKIPFIESDSCIFRIYRDDNPDELKNSALFGFGEIRCLDLSPDGKKLVSVGASGCLYIWDLQNRKITDTLCHSFMNASEITDVKWNQNNQIATISINHQLNIWDLKTKTYKSINALNYPTSIEWSNDNSKIAVGSDDGKLSIIDPSVGVKLLEIKKHNQKITGIKWSKDSKKIITCSTDSTIIVWNSIDLYPIKIQHHHDDVIICIDINPKNNLIASRDRYKTVIWDFEKDTVVDELFTNYYNYSEGKQQNIAWSNDGNSIITSHSNQIILYNYITKNKKIFSYDGKDPVFLSYSLDNEYFVFSNREKLFLSDVATNNIAFNMKGHNENNYNHGSYLITRIEFNKQSNIFFEDDNGTIRFWDASNQKMIRELENYYTPRWIPNSNHLIIKQSNKLFVYDYEEDKFIKEFNIKIKQNSDYPNFDIRPDGKQLAFSELVDSNSNLNRIKIIDINNEKVITEKNVTSLIEYIVWSADTNKIAFFSYSNVLVWNIKDDTTSSYPLLDHWNYSRISWNTNGKQLYIEDNNYKGKKSIYQLSSNFQLFQNVQGNDLKWSNNGYYFAIPNYYLYVYNSSSFDIKRQIVLNTYEGYNTLDWHPNNKWVVVAGGASGLIQLVRIIEAPSDTSDQYFSIIKPRITSDTVNMEDYCANEDIASSLVRNSFIQNNDIFPIRIDSIIIEGYYKDDFKLISEDLPLFINPDDVLDIEFRFQPLTPGLKFAEIVIYTNYEIVRKEISAIALDCNIQKKLSNFDFAEACMNRKQKLEIPFLYNKGVIESQVDSVRIIGNEANAFKYMGSDIFIINPGETHKILVEFYPKSDTIYNTQIYFYHKGISSPEIIDISGLGVKCEMLSSSNQDFNIHLPCDSNFIEKTFIAFVNHLRKDAIIDSVALLSNKIGFSLKNLVNFPFVLIDGEGIPVSITYEPKDPGQVCTKLRIYYDDQTSPKDVNICGSLMISEWEVSPDSLKIFNIIEGEEYQTQFIIKNRGNAELFWNEENIPFEFNGKEIISIEPNPTPAYSNSIVTVQFEGEPGTTRSLLKLSNNCSTRDSIYIYFISQNLQKFILKSDTLNCFPMDKIRVPFYLTSASHYLYETSDGITTSISYNNTILKQSNCNEIKLLKTELNSSKDESKLTIQLPKEIFLGRVFYLDFDVALGNNDTTAIKFDEDNTKIEGYPGGFIFSTHDGLVNVTVCQQGGKRLVNPNGIVSINSITPNPANQQIVVELSLLEKIGYEISIYNNLGQEIKQIIKSNSINGINTEIMNLNDVPSGIYRLILKTESVSISEKLIILK